MYWRNLIFHLNLKSPFPAVIILALKYPEYGMLFGIAIYGGIDIQLRTVGMHLSFEMQYRMPFANL